MKRFLVALSLFAWLTMPVMAAELPKVVVENGASKLLVHGKPYLMLGGELGNSSAGTEAQADMILPRLASLHVNTVLMPVAWSRSSRWKVASISTCSTIGSRWHANIRYIWYCFGSAVGRTAFPNTRRPG